MHLDRAGDVEVTCTDDGSGDEMDLLIKSWRVGQQDAFVFDLAVNLWRW